MQASSIVRRLDGAPDPLMLFERLRGRGPAILLESAAGPEKQPLRSLVVPATSLRLEARGGQVTALASSADGRAVLAYLKAQLPERLEEDSPEHARFAFPRSVDTDADDLTRLRAPSPLDVLRLLQACAQPRSSSTAAALLLAGVFAYDLIDAFEALPEPIADPLGYPDYLFFLAESVIDIDHRARSCRVRSWTFATGEARESPRYQDAMTRLAAQVSCCQQLAAAHPAVAPAPKRAPSAAPGVSDTSAGAETDLSDVAYADVVRRLKENIVAGDVFQIVPSRSFRMPCRDSIAAYRQLKALNPSPYMFYLDAGDHVLFGASPETSVQVERRNDAFDVCIRPIAGTRRRGRLPNGKLDRDLDNRLEADLKLDHKEIAEHMMLVDLARNDVARVSCAGSRRAERLLSVDRYANVIHLVSEVRGELRPGLDALHAYQASMNMGTLVGAPKVRAAQLLREHEGTKRGPYGGAIGYLAADGSMDSAIIIRSAMVRDGIATVRAGAGVVHDSEPISEARETRLKARSVLGAIAQAQEVT